MLDIKFVRENPDIVKKAAKDKNVELDVDGFLRIDKERRDLLKEVEGLKAEKNKVSDKIGKMMKKRENPKELIASMKVVSPKNSQN